MLLDIPELHAATLALVTERAGVGLSPIVRFQAEAVHEDAGRPDLECLDEEGRPCSWSRPSFTGPSAARVA